MLFTTLRQTDLVDTEGNLVGVVVSRNKVKVPVLFKYRKHHLIRYVDKWNVISVLIHPLRLKPVINF